MLFGALDEPENVIPGLRHVAIEDPDAEKDGLMDVERLGLGLDEERNTGIEVDIDQIRSPLLNLNESGL